MRVGLPGRSWLQRVAAGWLLLGWSQSSCRALDQAEPTPAAGQGIDTSFIERAWPRQWVRELEVGRHPVRWRERALRREGIFAGVRFLAPRERATVWALSSRFDGIGELTPGVRAVRVLEQSEARKVIEVDLRVLWKELTLRFEVEQEPPSVTRFRLVNDVIGEYRGVCRYTEAVPEDGGAAATQVELSTWLRPARPVPVGLILFVERMTLLKGVEGFLDSLESPPRTTKPSG